jgi:hypothetical protein
VVLNPGLPDAAGGNAGSATDLPDASEPSGPGQGDASDAGPGEEGLTEGGAPDQLTICSAVAGNEVVWCPMDSSVCDGEVQNGCPLLWGCDSFETARVNALESCYPNEAPFVVDGCGYRILGDRRSRGFYDETGTLLGTWRVDFYGNPLCSGDIPEACTGDLDLSAAESLCQQSVDAGTCLPPNSDPDVNVCSTHPTLSFTNQSGGDFVCVEECPLWWGCGPYQEAHDTLSVCADAGLLNVGGYAAKGCGYLILMGIRRDPSYGFYDEDTGELVAAWAADDFMGRSCSGAVPMGCLFGGDAPGVTDQVNLCAAGDAEPPDASDGG